METQLPASPPLIHSGRLFLWKIRIGFDFVDLLGVALTVRRDEKYPLICVQLLAQWAIRGVSPQIVMLLQEVLGFLPALDEMLERFLWRAETVGGLQRFRGLRLVAAVWNHGQHLIVDRLLVRGLGLGWGLHDLFEDHSLKHGLA